MRRARLCEGAAVMPLNVWHTLLCLCPSLSLSVCLSLSLSLVQHEMFSVYVNLIIFTLISGHEARGRWLKRAIELTTPTRVAGFKSKATIVGQLWCVEVGERLRHPPPIPGSCPLLHTRGKVQARWEASGVKSKATE